MYGAVCVYACVCCMYACVWVHVIFFSWLSSLLNSSGVRLTLIAELQAQRACASGLAAGIDGT